MTAGDPPSAPPPAWVPLAVMVGCGLMTFVGFISSPKLGLAFGGMTLVVYVGTVMWAVRYGRRQRRVLDARGERPDLQYLERRLRRYFWAILLCFVGATAGVLLALTGPDYLGPAWPLLLMLVLMAASLVAIWVFARVVLPRRREQEN
jgi:4-amino-4-deoxy-L-arabinose transferase-like glycosyltransferase